MKRHGKRILVLILVAALVIAAYIWHENQENHPYIEAMDASPSHFDLLFHRHGGVSFRQKAEGVTVYLAHYQRDELVFHEAVAGIGTVGAYIFEGSLIWGVTTEGGVADELRARLVTGGAMSSVHFDLAVLDFDFTAASTAGQPFLGERIDREGRFVLHLWQSEPSFRVDGNVFHPEQLQNSAHTVILYMVFE